VPELPEVETTRRGLAPHLEGRVIRELVLRRPDLRWPIPVNLPQLVANQRVHHVRRRAKYLLLELERGAVILHLGMSGVLRVLSAKTPVQKHDHVDFRLTGTEVLRMTDPRRFGAVLWQPTGTTHTLLAGLGPEPLDADFHAEYLFRKSRNRRAPLKAFLMDQATVVGVGNIYAAESLFAAKLDPRRPAGGVTLRAFGLLVDEVRRVLATAIAAGGTTLRDFKQPDSKPGYFAQSLQVYGRGNEPCAECAQPLTSIVLAQRATVYCARCQR
jgi:formamidopyrimidine-DNA glycosylase